ncbi:UDP-glycosyltransferase [Actinidia chinensis var. chinensis]|uniref:Glycosyltransferase n=1 Tax=Actinidia chinensis var. chinensis TaxID=1590841 RepID=A0A2R6R4Q7_ACTCC|nr:UDP-glycosyltransferase [Actinidia chinensis var. chinensis]
MASQYQPHVVIFPFMAQGHTLPLLDLSRALSQRQIKVTIITTPSNAISISQCLSDSPHISLTQIPFPAIPNLPKGCENTTQLPSMEFFFPFLIATKQLQEPFEQVLHNMSLSNSLPICVISDFFLGWTLSSCQAYGIPRLVFHGMGVLSMAISKSAFVHPPKVPLETNSDASSTSSPLHFPGLEKIPFVLTFDDLPDGINSPSRGDPFSRFLAEAGESEMNSWGVVVNSFLEMEGSYVSCLEAFYKSGVKAWCLGPFSVYDKRECFHGSPNQHQHQVIMNWLAKQADQAASVIYVSFGTQTDISDAQLDEVAYGLEESGVQFVWAVRSTTWFLPEGMEERMKGKGLIIKKWVDQRSILNHPATGGFLSHCGWNSVLESLLAGVPILAWPMIAEQPLNAKFVVEGLKAGIRVQKIQSLGAKADVRVSRQAICKGVMDLMKGKEGMDARERARGLGKAGRKAVQEGGSSYLALGNLIDQLCASGLN